MVGLIATEYEAKCSALIVVVKLNGELGNSFAVNILDN